MNYSSPPSTYPILQSSPPPPLSPGDFTIENTSFTLGRFASLVTVATLIGSSIIATYTILSVIIVKEYQAYKNRKYENNV